jgi:predicted nucleic acid-binding Zn ribbon protein
MFRKGPLIARKSNASTLGEAIEHMIDAYQLRSRFNETAIIAKWEELAGMAIANRTSKINVKNQVLYIQISDAAMRHELFMAKTKFIEMINREIGSPVIKEIIFS